jgi:hypothetical protein
MAGGVLFTVTRGDGGRLSNQRGVGTAGCRGPMGRDDRAGLVRYADSLRVSRLRAEPPPLTHVCG